MKAISFLSTCLLLVALRGYGQEGIDYDIKKPAKYDNRILGYEKTYTTKFKIPRHFIQNTVTHYNYAFNAANKLNEILARAKALHKDDFTRLLSFYNYSLDATATYRRDLDSIILRCTTAILVHDLRNDWVDNLYLMMGKAYFFRRQMDTAAMVFQFLNYAFGPKEEGGYLIPIGSNINADKGVTNLAISSDEKRNLLKRTFSLPPSRNDGLIWQVYTFLAQDRMSEAASLIELLKQDPLFPERLIPSLEEVQAFWFYKQGIYDSAAIHLERALPNATNKGELARWQYLIAQLYERVGKPTMAKAFYEKAEANAYDPVLDVHARLNAIRQDHGLGKGSEYVEKNLEALRKLARREIYAEYRDLIYYTAAQMELEQAHRGAAIGFLIKSTRVALPNSLYRNRSFLLLGDLAYEDKRYRDAKQYYDSVTMGDPASFDNLAAFTDRRNTLDRIVAQQDIVLRQDSLLRLAALPESERNDYIKKLVKALRRQQGLAEEDYTSAGSSLNSGPVAGDPFGGSSGSEWYFYNTQVKSKGFSDFKSKWGNRPNVDNWFLSGSLSGAGGPSRRNQGGVTPEGGAADASAAVQPAVSAEMLLSHIPLSEEKKQAALDSVDKALFLIGKLFQDGLPDYLAAIQAYDSLLSRFPQTKQREQTLVNLYYCYQKIGDLNNARRILDLLTQLYPNSKALHRIAQPNAPEFSEEAARQQATRHYEQVYEALISGDFEKAMEQKKIADSLFGEKYWTPQLLYIESLYFIHARMDAKAMIDLNSLIRKFPNSPMVPKAKNMISVLSRRKEIEDYLTNLQVERATDDTSSQARVVRPAPGAVTDSVLAKSKVALLPPAEAARFPKGNPIAPKIQGGAPPLPTVIVDTARLRSLRKKEDSLNRALAQSKRDAAYKARLQHQMDSLQSELNHLRSDSAQAVANRIAALHTAFVYKPGVSHSVAVVFTKVDQVYITEANNAFARFDRENYFAQNLQTSIVALNDSVKLVLIQGFETDAPAIAYMQKAKKLASAEILPWLPGSKYYFLITTQQNMEILQSSKDLPGFRKYLQTYYPGLF